MNKVFDQLTSIVGVKNILTEKKELIKYNKDWRGFYNNKSLCVLFPINTQILKEIVIFCFENNLKIVPQGGNTSLTGASVPTYQNQEIIINFSKMNKIVSVENEDLIPTVEPGVTRVQLNEYLRDQGLMFTVDPGADASIGNGSDAIDGADASMGNGSGASIGNGADDSAGSWLEQSCQEASVLSSRV